MTTQILYGITTVPTVIGLTQVAKQVGLPGRFAPLVAIALGILASLTQLTTGQATTWPQDIAEGVALGLAASGLYSGVTTAIATPDQPTTTAPTSSTPPATVKTQ